MFRKRISLYNVFFVCLKENENIEPDISLTQFLMYVLHMDCYIEKELI